MLKNELRELNKSEFDIFYNMKHIILSFIIVLSVALCGCALFSRLTPDGMEKASKAVGVATGYVVNHTSMSDSTKNSINEVLFKVSTVVPKAGETFADTWTPIAKEYTKALVYNGKINESEGAIVESAFKVICDGMDYIFGVKYTDVSNYMDLVSSAIHGFCNGFSTVVVPSTVMQAANLEFDQDAYNYLIELKNSRSSCR